MARPKKVIKEGSTSPVRTSPRKSTSPTLRERRKSSSVSPAKSPSKGTPKATSKSSRSSKSTSRSPKKRVHSSYLSMITKAIKHNDHTEGSSLIFLTKFIKANNEINVTDAAFRRYLKLALKRAVDKGILIKTRASYRLPSKSTRQTTKRKSSTKKTTAKASTPKSPVRKSKSSSTRSTPKETPSPKKRKSPSTTTTAAVAASPKRSKKVTVKSPSKKRTNTKKKSGKEEKTVEDEENILPNITTTGVVFNTTDLPEVRLDVKSTIGSLLTDDEVRVGIIANRGWKNSKYNLEILDFDDNENKINEFVENSFGEGSAWLDYYREVLTTALTFSWGTNRKKVLILIGNEGLSAATALPAEVGKLAAIGVKVFAFHHTQLELLQSVLKDLD